MAKHNQGEMTFDKALKGFVTSTKNSMKYARICAELALIHFHKHGDLVYCQNFIDAIEKYGKNYVRRNAFLGWLANFSPVKMAEGKLLKDTSEGAIEFDVDGARAMPFWEFAPEQGIIEFGPEDVVKALQGVIKRFRNDRHQPINDLTKLVLADAEKAISKVHVPVNADLEPSDDDDGEDEEQDGEMPDHTPPEADNQDQPAEQVAIH